MYKIPGLACDECRLVSRPGESVTCSNGLRLQPGHRLDDLVDADLFIVQGISTSKYKKADQQRVVN
ncbi:hypothetical protein [Neptunomonas qingdaonensis]|uniref:Uncharacterized protein n=1 Tax=Neptunomonas qingdaonensis TaxID=1045558 RepID=A0A1I2P508_9GAMM|nr:hypothetical protein [Neptunomonas qingdaonensis]SFG10560.1 hypothetical protein SAMN05216175_103246 [Neptunomonas qingdaonensis]